MNQNETRERDVCEMIRRSTVAKPLTERCEQIARAAGFEKQLAGPHDYHAWVKELSDDRVVFIARPAPFGLRQDEFVDRAPRRSRPALLVAHFRSGHA